jgi:hypothetical protein
MGFQELQTCNKLHIFYYFYSTRGIIDLENVMPFNLKVGNKF